MRLLTLCAALLLTTLLSAAPIPATKEKKKELNTFPSMIGIWKVQWNQIVDAEITFHPDGSYQWYDKSCGNWEGRWEQKDNVVTIKERRLDEDKEYWYESTTTFGKDFKGSLLIHPDDTSGKVEYKRVNLKGDF